MLLHICTFCTGINQLYLGAYLFQNVLRLIFLSLPGNCNGMWIPGCLRLECCCFLRSEDEREDLALRQTEYLLGRASCWWEGLRGQRCRGLGKRQQDGGHSLMSLNGGFKKLNRISFLHSCISFAPN